MSTASPLVRADYVKRAGYYRDVRIGLDLTQSDFASLLGCHPVTVSKWETANGRPNRHRQALIAAFQQAIDADAPIRPDLDAVISSCGPVYTLYLVLHAAHGVS